MPRNVQLGNVHKSRQPISMIFRLLPLFYLCPLFVNPTLPLELTAFVDVPLRYRMVF